MFFFNLLKFVLYISLIILRCPLFFISRLAQMLFIFNVIIFIFIYFFSDKSMKNIELIFVFSGILIMIKILEYFYDKLIFWCSPKDNYDDY